MNALERLILLNQRIEELQADIAAYRQERELALKVAKIGFRALGDIINEGLSGDAAFKRAQLAIDTVEVLCS